MNFTRDYLAAVQQVTEDDVLRVAGKYFTRENLTITSLNPKGALGLTSDSAQHAAAGEIQKISLTNGLRILVREDTRLPLIAMTAIFRGGLLAETPATNGITHLMAKTLLKGTTTRSAEQIAETIESVGGHLGSDSGNNSFSITMEVTQPDLRLGAELLADVLLNATMPDEVVAREKDVQLAAIKDEEEQLTSVARNILRAALFRDHPYALRGKGSADAVAKLTQKDLLQFRDKFLVARNGVLAVFGNVKAAEVKELFEQLLAQMKPGELALEKVASSVPITKAIEVESTRDKAQAVLMAGFRGADLFSKDRYVLDLIDEASSDLGSRFFIRIREQMGLAYYVGSSQLQGLVPGMFAFYLGTDPQKVPAVKAALLDEIQKLASDGLTSEELARAKKKLIGQQQIANQSNDSFSYAAGLDEIYGLGFDHYKELEAQVESVTPEDVKRVAAKYFRDQPFVLATVRPSGDGTS